MLTTTRIDIDELVKVELPPLPGPALRVAALAEDPNSSARAVADAIGLDPMLAANVLRAANSPLYAMQRQVTALPAAVNMLGNHAVHLLVMMSATSGAFKGKGKPTKVERLLWEHSVAVGLTARETSRQLGMRGAEEAFLCGLLHDIGKLLLLRHDPQTYADLEKIADEDEMLERERELFGYTHAQVGALVARRWNLPEEIIYAIYYHHTASEAETAIFTSRVIDIADRLAIANGHGTRPEGGHDPSRSDSAIAMNLSAEQLSQIWDNIEGSLGLMTDLFK